VCSHKGLRRPENHRFPSFHPSVRDAKEPFVTIQCRFAFSVFSCATLTLTALRASAGPTVSFANDIQPIFTARCAFCHTDRPGGPAGSLYLDEGRAYADLVNQPTSDGCMAEAPGSVRVVPFDPLSSMLWLKTRPDDARCGVPMPWGTPGLGIDFPDEFALLETWISQGALDN
jgi:hypothetical protein